MKFNRWTTEYVELEDRLRISGEADGETPIAVWISRRLLVRLLPLLIEWLEAQVSDTSHAATLLQWEQQAAAAELKPEPPVIARDPSMAWVVTSIDVQRDQRQLTLVLKSEGSDRTVGATMTAHALRQWINIVHAQSERADWGISVWPSWIGSSPAEHDREKIRFH
jgi:hypothetical protein